MTSVERIFFGLCIGFIGLMVAFSVAYLILMLYWYPVASLMFAAVVGAVWLVGWIVAPWVGRKIGF